MENLSWMTVDEVRSARNSMERQVAAILQNPPERRPDEAFTTWVKRVEREQSKRITKWRELQEQFTRMTQPQVQA